MAAIIVTARHDVDEKPLYKRDMSPVMPPRRTAVVGCILGLERMAASRTGFRPGDIWIAPGIDLPAHGSILEVGADPFEIPAESADTVVAANILEYVADYRAVIQAWFSAVAPDGHLVITVRHAFLYERRLLPPARRDAAQRRLYTPRVLLDEVEEALVPNSYRVRRLCDLDDNYDYAMPRDAEPTGRSDVLLVLQKIHGPEWTLETPSLPGTVRGSAPDYGFEPGRSRVETLAASQPHRICALKLDHLGDFIMGMAPLAQLRNAFPQAEITLVVGSWNAQLARDTGLADTVVAFDAFPRNASEEEVDVPGKTSLFRAAVSGSFDLAIDLRIETDTRILLRAVNAAIRAGIGTRSAFPFMDIFLPVDFTRGEAEAVREEVLGPHAFAYQAPARRTDYRIVSQADTVERSTAIIWGPYRRLRPGRYFFEPFLELGENVEGGVLLIDVALDAQRVVHKTLPTSERMQLHFSVHGSDQTFEARIWALDEMPAIDFSFYGGRLVRAGADSVLHQSEYGELLVELVRLRCARGMLVDAAGR